MKLTIKSKASTLIPQSRSYKTILFEQHGWRVNNDKNYIKIPCSVNVP
jgi:hypothetical protein